MGKKSRLKAERREQPAGTSMAKTFRAVKAAENQHLYEELHHHLQRHHLLSLNDQPFTHPDNLHKLDLTFGPMERWLQQQLTTGESDALRDGTVVFRPSPEDSYYPVGDSFISMADTYELIAADMKIPDEGDGARKLGKRLNAHMPLDLLAVRAAQQSLVWMRSVTMSLSPRTFHPYTDSISTRYELQRLGVITE